MNYFILFYAIICVGVMFYLANVADKVAVSKIIKVHHVVVAILFLPSTIIILILIVLYEIVKKIISYKIFTKIANFMNKPAIDFNNKHVKKYNKRNKLK